MEVVKNIKDVVEHKIRYLIAHMPMNTIKLWDIVDILDNQRVPISSAERENRIEGLSQDQLVPYYGATQQNGWIDDYIFNEELVLLWEDWVPFLDRDKNKAYIISWKSRVNNHAHVLRAKHWITTNKFLYYFLNIFNYNWYVTGATRLKLNQSSLKKIPVPLPPLPVQEQIAERLDAIQSLIAEREQSIADLDELARSIFYTTFGDPVLNEKWWKVEKLEKIAKVWSSRRVFTRDFTESWVPFYRWQEIGELAAWTFVEPIYFISEDHFTELKEATWPAHIGDLLLPSICSDWRIWRVDTDEPFYFKDGRVLWIQPNIEKVKSRYLQAFLKNLFIANYEQIASWTTFKELKIFILKDLNIPLSPLDLQQSFAEQIQEIESLKSEYKSSLADLQMLYDQQLQESFSF